MASSTRTVHVYNCSHVEVEYVEGEDSEVFVFVLGPCSSGVCNSTDPAWFTEGCAAPTVEELQPLKNLTSALWHIKARVRKMLSTFDRLEPTRLEEIAAVVSDPEIPKIFNLLDTEARQNEIEEWLGVATTQTLLKYARGFQHKTRRPFFDFCLNEACHYVEHAEAKVRKLQDVVHELMKNQGLLGDPNTLTCHWPNSEEDYEPDFGLDEVKFLRLSPEGLRLLGRPFSRSSLCFAETLVSRESKQRGLTTPPQATQPIIATDEALHPSLEQLVAEFRSSKTGTRNKHALPSQWKPTGIRKLVKW